MPAILVVGKVLTGNHTLVKLCQLLFLRKFRLFISVFADLAETSSLYLPRMILILENSAALKCSVIMLAIGCQDLVLDIVRIILSAVRYN